MFKSLKRPGLLGLLRNAINAKLTLQRCTRDEKMRVYVYANALYASSGSITDLEAAIAKVTRNIRQIDAAFARMSEFERNTLYSLSMMELGIEPVLIAESWNVPPRNPLAANSDIEKTDIECAVSYFWDKHRLEVAMDVQAGS